MQDDRAATVGMFYTFVNYLENLNERLYKYSDQPVIFYVENRGNFTVTGCKKNILDKGVYIETVEANDDGTVVLNLNDLLSLLKPMQEDCFDFIPILTQNEVLLEEHSYSSNDIPIFETAVGLNEDCSIYAFIVKSI